MRGNHLYFNLLGLALLCSVGVVVGTHDSLSQISETASASRHIHRHLRDQPDAASAQADIKGERDNQVFKHGDDESLHDGIRAPEIRTRALRSILSDLEESALHLPKTIDDMLDSAISSLDHAAGGMLSGLASLNVDYARSEDNSKLIVRVHLPPLGPDDNKRSSPRTVRAAVVGQSHLRTTVTTTTDSFSTESTHTFPLPARVSKDDVEISSKPDGTVHITLRMLKAEEGGREHDWSASNDENDTSGETLPKNPFGRFFFPALLLGGQEQNDSGERDTRLEVPSADSVDGCKEKHSNDRLLVDKCLCDSTSDADSKAVCYANLISRSVKMARKLGMDDVATSAKHVAMECASDADNKVGCLEKVVGDLIRNVYNGKGASADISDRIRQAIESEDDGPSNFHPSFGYMIIKLVIIGLLLMGVFWACVLFASRRGILVNRAVGAFQQLSSVLSQSSDGPQRSKTGSSTAGKHVGRNVPGGKIGSGVGRGSKIA